MESKKEPSGRKHRLVLVDDDPTTVAMAEEMLPPEEFALRTFTDPLAAWQALEQEVPDLLVLDILMPGLDGLEFCRRVRRYPWGVDLPVLVMTAKDDHAAINAAFEAGATDFTPKPVNWVLEVHRLRFLLRSAEMTRQIRLQEAAMRQAKDEWERTFDSISDGVFVFDADCRLKRVNLAAARMLRQPRAELLGKNCRELFACPQDECVFGCPLRETRDKGDTTTLEWSPPYPGGRWRSTVGRVPGGEQEPPLYVFTALDRTPWLQMEARLRQAEKLQAIGRLAGGVAHDFNNLLSVVLTNTELAMEMAGNCPKAKGYLEEILRAAERSAELTRQLLTFARKQPIQRRPTDLNREIQEMRSMLQPLIGEQVELVLELADELPAVLVDPTQITQALTNLCANARDAIAGPGRVVIGTAAVELTQPPPKAWGKPRPGRFVRLTVRDNGSGIPPEQMERLFEPFHTTKEVGRGTGLGLASVLGAVEQNEGFIEVESAPGQGTAFKLHLPVTTEAPADAPGASSGGTPAGQPSSRRFTVLFVEDEPSVLKPGVRALEQAGYRVLAAGTAREALALAATAPDIDLLITDVVMPEMNGKELCERLRATRPGLPVLFVSGYARDIIAGQGVLPGDLHFLQKPFSLKTLAAKVGEILRGGSAA